MNTEKPKQTEAGKPAAPKRKQIVAAVILVALALCALAIFAIGSWGRKSGTAAQAPTFTVRRGPLTINVNEAGTIRSREKQIIKSEVSGSTTIIWLIPEGTRVKAGDLLIELDASDFVDRRDQQLIVVQNAEAAYISARENLEVAKNQVASDIAQAELDCKFAKLDQNKYLEGEYPQELQRAESDITIAREELQRAADKLDWSKRLAQEGYITRMELQADELAAKRVELDLNLAEGSLQLLKQYTYKRQVEQLKSDIEQTAMALERTKKKASADIIQTEATLKAKGSEFKRQQAKLEKLVEQIGKCKIKAPVPGMVVYATTGQLSRRGNAEPLDTGQTVRERQELIHLPTAEAMTVDLQIHESSLTKVSKGMPARVTVDALSGKVFTGRVHKISPLPNAQSAWLNPDLKVYSTEIYLDGNAGELSTGMSCRAEIVVKEYDEATYVPVQSVVRLNGKPTVYVATPEGARPRNVELGLDNNRMIHILSGLEPGEKVLLAPPLSPSTKEFDEAPSDGEQSSDQEEKPKAPPTPDTPAAPAGDEETAKEHPPQPQQDNIPDRLKERLKDLSPEEQKELLKKWRERRATRNGQRPRPQTEQP